MPFIIPFIPLIAAGVGAATTAVSIADRPSAPAGQQTTAPATPAPNTAGLSQAQKQLASTTTANTQAATSGFATPDYIQSLLQGQFGPSAANGTGSGASGDIQNVINQAFGLGSPGTSGYSGTGGSSPTTSAAPSLSAFAAAAPGGGGPVGPSALPGGPGSSASPNLVGSLLDQNFSGFSA